MPHVPVFQHEIGKWRPSWRGRIHGVAVAATIPAGVILTMVTPTGLARWAFLIYVFSLFALFSTSASYHLLTRSQRAQRTMRQLDHAMIYVLIAATYTPVAFLALSGGWKWAIFGTIWGMAVIGVLAKTLITHPGKMSAYLSTVLYVVMGWLIVVAIVPLIKGTSTPAFITLFCGGVAYTLGAVFFALDEIVPKKKHFWMHEIFHVFVLAGSALHTITMFLLMGL